MSNARMFITNTHPGLTRAVLQEDGIWQTTKILEDQDVRCLTQDPANEGVIFAGTQGNGILRSEDWGETWQNVGLEGMVIKSIAISAAKPGFMLAGSKPPFVYASYDGGAMWHELLGFRKVPSRPFWRSPAEPPGTAYVQSVAISPTDPDTVIAGVEFGAVIRSTDGGKTWPGHRPGALRDCHTLMFHSTDGRYAYEAGGTGVGAAISRNAGETWEQPRTGLDRHYGWAICADPADPTIAYMSAAPGPMKAHSESRSSEAHIFRLNGNTWEKLSGGLPDPLTSMPYVLLTDPTAAGHVYAGLHNGELWFSANYGDEWQALPLHLGRIGGALIMS